MHKILYVASILYANLYNESNIDITNGSVLNDKFIKASNGYW